MAGFNAHIGIDYSGAKTPTSGLPGLRVYRSEGDEEPRAVISPSSGDGRPRHWTRQQIADWIVEQLRSAQRLIVGIDHAFSLPHSYFQRYELTSWIQFLDDFVVHWPTHEPHNYVDFIRDRGPTRTGDRTELRITERWTSSAKSVFAFDMQGQVAKSTHAGIPWLHHIRRTVGDTVHFWPFDGWHPDLDKSVLAEVYPSVFRNRYPREDRTGDEQDAYATARWLSVMDGRGFLERYFHPPLAEEEQRVAKLEGWILGVF